MIKLRLFLFSGSVNDKLDNIKGWSINTYKCTKQVLMEKLGKSARTVNAEVERDIANVREAQKKHLALLTSVQNMIAHFSAIVVAQRSLQEIFTGMVPISPPLQEALETNANDQQVLSLNGEHLLGKDCYLILVIIVLLPDFKSEETTNKTLVKIPSVF